VIHQTDATIAAIKPVGPSLFRVTFACALIARRSAPGNFVHLLISEREDPFWRRAFSVHNVDPLRGTFEIVFKVVGRGTTLLSRSKKGNRLNLLGPLGNSFTIPSKGSNVFLVAGGVGVPPLHFLAKVLIEKRKLSPGSISFFVGTKTKAEHFCLPELRRMGLRLFPATDDGSLGYAGFVTSHLKESIRSTSLPLDDLKVYACGPPEMLKEMAMLSSEYGLFCEASLETVMPCGVGACMGCVVKVKQHEDQDRFAFRRVCREGPVFPVTSIDWGS
jgi:dihydroorotate dehydrogenase electron transfer subunit